MKIPDDIRKCVGFIGYKMANEEFVFAGSVFFLGDNKSNGKEDTVFCVTAKHVITEIKNLGIDKVYVRLNQTGGNAEWGEQIPIASWRLHPTDNTVDVAVGRVFKMI